MKKISTFIDESASEWEAVIISAGKIGLRIESSLGELKKR